MRRPTLTLNRHLLSRDSSSTRETIVPVNHWQTMWLNFEFLKEYCDFGKTIEDLSRDRLVCDINDHGIQCCLLQESNLTYESAYDIAKDMETASKNIQDPCKILPTVQHVQVLEVHPVHVTGAEVTSSQTSVIFVF